MKHTWLHQLWYAIRLKRLSSIPYIQKLESDVLKSNALLEISVQIAPHWLFLKKILIKMGVKSIQELRSRIERDEFGKQALKSIPLFSQNEVDRIRSKRLQSFVWLILFVASESFLYFLIVPLFTPGADLLVKSCVSVFLALITLMALGYGFEHHFKYTDAADHFRRGEISALQLRSYRDKKVIGYFLLTLGLVTIFYSGLARSFYLEYIPVESLPNGKAESVRRASAAASMVTLLVTFLTGIYLAALKLELRSVSTRFKVYTYWRKAHQRKNSLTQKAIRHATAIQEIVEQCLEKYWQLSCDVKKILKPEQEYDKFYEPLYIEYISLKARHDHFVNDFVYQKYAPIQGSFEELLKYGITHNRELKEKIDMCTLLYQSSEDHIAYQLSAMEGNASLQKNLPPSSTDSNQTI